MLPEHRKWDSGGIRKSEVAARTRCEIDKKRERKIVYLSIYILDSIRIERGGSEKAWVMRRKSEIICGELA